MVEIYFGVDKAANESKNAYKRVCEVVQNSLIPQAEELGDEAIFAAGKVLEEMTCTFAYGIDYVKSQPKQADEHLDIDPTRITFWANQLASAPKTVLTEKSTQVDYGLDEPQKNEGNKYALQNICSTIIDIVPALKTATRTKYVFCKNAAVPASFLDEGLTCAANAVTKLSCEIAAGKSVDIQKDVECLHMFADKLHKINISKKIHPGGDPSFITETVV